MRLSSHVDWARIGVKCFFGEEFSSASDLYTDERDRGCIHARCDERGLRASGVGRLIGRTALQPGWEMQVALR
jgi:hypothetical protein